MGVFHWFGQNWFILLESVGIVGGLVFTGISLHESTKSQRVANLIAITQHHREIWTYLYTRPSLSRVINPDLNLWRAPVTDEEALFVSLLVLHLGAVFEAMKARSFPKREGLGQDIRSFFSL